MQMRRSFLTALATVALSALVAGGPALAADGTTTCTDTLASGTYLRVVVPAGAVCLSDGPVTIRAGLFVEEGATFVLGSEENPVSTGTISGGVHATNAGSVQIHFATINGAVVIQGGAGPFGGPFDFGGGFDPTWTTLEDNVINGSVSFVGYDGFWSGFIRNTVNGSVVFADNDVLDPDGNEVVTNTIHGSLVCSGNSPAPQVGDSGGSPNAVTGAKVGQCANL
jgi:hypothetical protein